MKNNTGRNIFLIVLGYYLLTGNYKAARNLVVAYLAMMLIAGLIFLGIFFQKEAEERRQEAYHRELQAEQNKKNKLEAEQFAADVLPAFVKQFKGKTLKGEFNDFSSLDRYSVKFKILNDSTLTYQICEDEDYAGYCSGSRQKWSASKKTGYTIAPAVNDNGAVVKERLIFQFESYHGDLEVIKSKKKKKYLITTPLTLKDADGLYGCFWEW